MKSTYSVAEAAKLLGYSKNSVYGFLKNKEIKSTRLGKGKFRIAQEEIARVLARKPEEIQKTEEVEDEPRSRPVERKVGDGDVLQSALLPPPRPGKSLSDLSGESVLHTLRLWFAERVGFPSLFDWLASLNSIIIGLSLYLYSSQLDLLSLGRLSLWLNPIRLGLMLGGVGLILASMIQGEVNKKVSPTNIFRFFLSATYFGLAAVLFIGAEYDGFLIHGLFGLMILVEAISGVESATLYVLYILGLLASIFVTFSFFPNSSFMGSAMLGLKSIFGSFSWLISLLMIVLFMSGIYGLFWNKKLLRNISLVYGVLLCVLAIYYGSGNFWSRSFSVLIAGLIGLVLPNWEMFKARLVTDRPMVFKMFGTVLVCFAVVILLIAVVQGTLVNNTNRVLFDKAEFVKVELAKNINDLKAGATDLANNSSFINAYNRVQREELNNQLKLLSLGRKDLVIVGVIDKGGKVLVTYPASVVISDTIFSKSGFYTTIMNTGGVYNSAELESLTGEINNVFVIAVPIADSRKVVNGVLVVAISGVNLSSEMQSIGQAELGQEVFAIGEGGKMMIHPDLSKLGTVVNEADTGYDLWKSELINKDGYNYRGVHCLFGASRLPEYGQTLIVAEPLQKALDVSSSWLSGLLLLLLVVGIGVLVAYIYINKKPIEEET
jgi:excisionase family DNA binding protein